MGIAARIGARMGSVTVKRNREIGLRYIGSNQEIKALAMISHQKICKRKFRKRTSIIVSVSCQGMLLCNLPFQGNTFSNSQFATSQPRSVSRQRPSRC